MPWGLALGPRGRRHSHSTKGCVRARHHSYLGAWRISGLLGPRGWKLPVETTARPATAARLAPPRSQRVIRESGFQLGTAEPWVDHVAQKPWCRKEDISQPACRAPSVSTRHPCEGASARVAQPRGLRTWVPCDFEHFHPSSSSWPEPSPP